LEVLGNILTYRPKGRKRKIWKKLGILDWRFISRACTFRNFDRRAAFGAAVGGGAKVVAASKTNARSALSVNLCGHMHDREDRCEECHQRITHQQSA